MSDQFDGFTICIIKDEDDQFLAHLTELPNVSAFGDTPEQALTELEVAWQAMKESYLKHGEIIPVAPIKRDYSGQFNVRVGKELHRNLAVQAARLGLSLNALISQKLTKAV